MEEEKNLNQEQYAAIDAVQQLLKLDDVSFLKQNLKDMLFTSLRSDLTDDKTTRDGYITVFENVNEFLDKIDNIDFRILKLYKVS